MTDKKAKILEVALGLFANEGYNAVSTNKIAKQAGVSEGLIFRHFGNKKGLLEAIMNEMESRVEAIFATIKDQGPLSVIHDILDLPLLIKEDEYSFWRLQFKLRWQRDYYEQKKDYPVLEKMIWAFSELGYAEPENEARLLGYLLEGVVKGMLRGDEKNQQAFIAFLKRKYNIDTN